MPAIRHDSLLLRLLKDMNDVRSVLRRVVANIPLFDIGNENTPVQITADQNNYVPGNYDILRLSSDAAGRTITGFRGGMKGRFLRLFNVGNYEMLLAHQSVSSDAANRIISTTQTDILINASGEIALYYDSTQQRWIASYNSNANRITVNLQLAAAQSIPNASYQQISWSSVIEDTGSFFDVATPTYVTIPETGWYQVSAHITFNNGAGFREVMAERAIAAPHGNISFDSRPAASGGSTNVELARLQYFDIGERIYLTVWQNSGGALDVNPTGPRTSVSNLVVSKM